MKNKRITYKEFHVITTKIALGLVKKGIKHGDIVSICMERDERLLFSLFGVIKSGAIYMVIDKEWPIERKEYVYKTSETRYIIDEKFYEELLSIDISEYGDIENEANVRNYLVKNNPNDIAAIYWTSGSTGKPKGVSRTHHSIVMDTFPFKGHPDYKLYKDY